MYSPSNSTLVAWWTGFGDPESSIKNFEVRLLEGRGSCTGENVDSMTVIVDWTTLSENSTSYEFLYLTLQVRIREI